MKPMCRDDVLIVDTPRRYSLSNIQADRRLSHALPRREPSSLGYPGTTCSWHHVPGPPAPHALRPEKRPKTEKKTQGKLTQRRLLPRPSALSPQVGASSLDQPGEEFAQALPDEKFSFSPLEEGI